MPFNIANAYGVKPSSLQSNQPLRGSEGDAANRSATRRLVAGTVPAGITFDASETTPPRQLTAPRHVLSMYTRAADKVEAAVGVQIGRMIDLKA